MNAANCGKLQGIAANCRELRRIGDSLLKKNSSAAKLQRISDELHQIASNWEESPLKKNSSTAQLQRISDELHIKLQ